jgi:hypothetical protein
VNEKLMEHHPELITVWEDLENSFQAKPIPVDQPKDLVLPLLPFQKEGVGWMRDQEKSLDVSFISAYIVVSKLHLIDVYYPSSSKAVYWL